VQAGVAISDHGAVGSAGRLTLVPVRHSGGEGRTMGHTGV
jgi:hypothetical protein